MGRSPGGRNALLASLHFARAEILSASSQQLPSKLLSSCREYFGGAASKVYCYDDLRDTIELLDTEAQQSFLNHVKTVCDQVYSGDQPDKVEFLKIP